MAEGHAPKWAMERALGALRAGLSRPAPAWSWWVIALFVVGSFLLAWWAFAFPLTYCDSLSWAPSYLGRLVGSDALVSAKHRGVLVPAWFQLWGGLSVASGFGNLIGLVQAAGLASVVLMVLVYLRCGMTTAELLVFPALALSGLRLAIYSQTLMSEAIVIPLVITVAFWILREGTPSLLQCAAMGGLAALAASARIENLLLLPLLLARIAMDSSPWCDRVRAVGLALGVGLAVLVALAQLSPPAPAEPIGKTMVVAEWMRFTEPPRTALARLLHFDLVESLRAETEGSRIRHIYDGLPPARRAFAMWGVPDWLDILRLLAYQCANRPFAVLADRLATLADLHATGYAAFWPAYRAWSAFYSPYDQVFARWAASDFLLARYSCPGFARAQAAYYDRPAIRSPRALRLLQVLHEGAEGYAKWVLRALYWAAVPACLYVLWRGLGGRPYGWLTALLLGHLALRAALVCADERYQLPVDLLAVAWIALTVRYALGLRRLDARPRCAHSRT